MKSDFCNESHSCVSTFTADRERAKNCKYVMSDLMSSRTWHVISQTTCTRLTCRSSCLIFLDLQKSHQDPSVLTSFSISLIVFFAVFCHPSTILPQAQLTQDFRIMIPESSHFSSKNLERSHLVKFSLNFFGENFKYWSQVFTEQF